MRVLMTGAAGIVGTVIRPFLAEYFDEMVLLTHRTPAKDLLPNERSVKGDIQDRDFVDSIMADVDGLIHLAGLVGPDYTFDQVLGPNIVGTYNLFEACRTNGVRQIVYASSHHAIGFLPRGTAIDENTPIRADSYYGVSKAFGEVLGAYFADKYGLNVLSIRIGSVGEKAIDERRMHTWSSPRDLARLIELGLTREEQGYRLVYGVSDCPEPFFDNRSATEMGYSPLDNSLDFLADPSLRDALPDLSNPQNRYIGGYFASQGMSDSVPKDRKACAG
ncbi:MAG: NAD-dependent epimerase/dehydratase family protein [Chitinivibrionales bacterium]|nr:NAD-dependent epimerase/dehydratase family protein [Chitinivibrionales bacterium]